MTLQRTTIFSNCIRVLTCLILAWIATGITQAAKLSSLGNQDALLEPARAFSTTVTADSANFLSVAIDIAPGYYLYKSKISLTAPEGVQLGDPQLPQAVIVHDEFFGEVGTYRGPLHFQVPIITGVGAHAITIQSQGCADIGVCYPPYSAAYQVEIPAVDNKPSALTKLSSLSAQSQAPVLSPDQAFVLTSSDLNGNKLTLNWHIEDGYYLYDHKFSFSPAANSLLVVNDSELSEGKKKTDEFFGEVEVHRQSATAVLTLAGTPQSNTATLTVGYQGCADIGICYPPVQKDITFSIVDANFNGESTSNANTLNGQNSAQANTTNARPKAQQDILADKLRGDSRILTIATFFGLGLLLTFTPCVLPMIPILSSIVVGDGQQTTAKRAFTLSLVYVLAMALTYTIAGVIVGLSGENLQATLQHPFVIFGIALIFIILSLSMFGLFELQLPLAMQNKLTEFSGRQKGGRYTGVAIMGILSALIVGPCVTAPLVGALIYIAQTGDAVLGGAALFALSMGMGLPLLIIGTSFGKYLPRAGGWMETVKGVFGILLLALAIWMLDRVVPTWVTMLLASILLICTGMIFTNARKDHNLPAGIGYLAQGVGFAALVYGTLLMIGIATGKGSLIEPLKGLAVSANVNSLNSSHSELSFVQIKGPQELEQKLALAKQASQPVMLDFYADWCVSCKEMEAFTFSDANVVSKLDGTLLLQADVTANDKLDKALLDKFGLFGPPAILFYDSLGKEQADTRVVGYMAPKEFIQILEHVIN